MRRELIEALDLLHSGEPEGVQRAVALMQGTVFSFSMKVCGHREDAEDTMQDVLMRSLPHLAKIKDPQALAVWLYTVTRNRCWRSRRRPAHAPNSTLSLDELMPDEGELQRMLQDTSPGPEESALRGENDRILHKAVLSLPPQYRLVLVLHDMEDLETEQVAAIMGLKPGTVRVRLHRARLGVRKAMAQLLEGKAISLSNKPAKETGTRRHPPSEECKKMFAGLSEYLEGRLAPVTCDQMQKHMDSCPACVAFLRELAAAIQRCREFDIACDPDVSNRLVALIAEEFHRLRGQTT